jgi:hypothetical protein
MRPPARLIIPLWGSIYAEKLTSMTLPELLAPGNLPALSAMLTSDVVLVTEASLSITSGRRARSSGSPQDQQMRAVATALGVDGTSRGRGSPNG